ncbi:uncharacterized protein PAC_06914 [Phialocephala subalpina]|uniref:Uncharacterized protein n=1 Tax=Phialocephala subalpina TaxID=576137 RepID=A0A1L7WW69_9HELO|nr:uncharacterized protein PAC_06914 [Phialocephala subalpina]
MPTIFKAPNYSSTPSGFLHVYIHRKYLGFIEDIEDCNRLQLLTYSPSRQEIEALFIRTLTDLHQEWWSDMTKGGQLSNLTRNKLLDEALSMMRGPDVERYWEERRMEEEAAREQELLIGASRARVAKWKGTQVVVITELTNMLEQQSLKDEKDRDGDLEMNGS